MRSIVYFFVLFTITFVSCNYQVREKGDMALSSEDTLLARRLRFPETLLELKHNQLVSIDNLVRNMENNQKVISIIDISCIKCIAGQLNQVDSVFRTLMGRDDLMIFILNIKKTDSANFMNNLRPLIKSDAALIWDSNYYFERENNLLTEEMNLRTFMLDDNNRIVQYGNPLFNPDLIIHYKNKLN